MKTGIELIVKERQEQIEKHGWSKDHDDHHVNNELIEAAVMCASPYIVYRKEHYANQVHFVAVNIDWNLPVNWNGNVLQPNSESSKEERIHQLKVAGALIAAEIDRIQNK